MPMRYPYGRLGGHLGDLPEPLGRERLPGKMIDPHAELALDWINRYKTQAFSVLTTAGVGQTVLQNNPLRCYLMVQNLDAATDLHINWNTDAIVGNSPLIIPRGNAEFIGGEAGGSFCPQDSVNIVSSLAIRVAIIEGTLMPYELATRR